MSLRERLIVLANASTRSKFKHTREELARAAARMALEDAAQVCGQIASPKGLRDPSTPPDTARYYCDDGYGCSAAIRTLRDGLD